MGTVDARTADDQPPEPASQDRFAGLKVPAVKMVEA
jgi:hypothetical protein